MPNTAKLLDTCRAAFDRKGWTYDQLAEKAAQSKTTAYNYMTGKVEDPKRATVERFAEALGVDVDELAEPESAAPPTHCDRCRAAQNEHNRLLREDFNIRHEETRADCDKRIEELKRLYEQRLDDHKQRIRWLSAVCIVLVAFICAVLLIDLLHGGVGWFRYSATSGRHGVWQEVVRYVADAINLL